MMDAAALADTLAEVYSHGYGRSPAGPAAQVRTVGETAGMAESPTLPGVGLDHWWHTGGHPAVVAQVLRAVLAPCRWEPWNYYHEHRCYPSPRTAFLVTAQVAVAGRCWRLDPSRDRLTLADDLSGAGTGTGRADPARPPPPRGDEPVEVRLVVAPERMPGGYGALATALAWLECGHIAGAFAEAAAAAGLAAASALRSDLSGVTVTLRSGADAAWPWARVTARRSSGVGPRGLAPDQRPLPGALLAAMATASQELPPGSPAETIPLRHRLAVRGVSDAVDGWYAVEQGRARSDTPGPAMAQVAAAAGAPPAAVDVASMNLGWVMTGPVAAAVRTGGPAGYRRVLLAAGATAQHLSSAAAVSGLFCRPVRNVREPLLEAAAGAPADHDFLYLLLIGRSAVRDFSYDLTCPGGRP